MICVYSKDTKQPGWTSRWKLIFHERGNLSALRVDASWIDRAQCRTI